MSGNKTSRCEGWRGIHRIRGRSEGVGTFVNLMWKMCFDEKEFFWNAWRRWLAFAIWSLECGAKGADRVVVLEALTFPGPAKTLCSACQADAHPRLDRPPTWQERLFAPTVLLQVAKARNSPLSSLEVAKDVRREASKWCSALFEGHCKDKLWLLRLPTSGENARLWPRSSRDRRHGDAF